MSILLRILISVLLTASTQAAEESHWYQVEIIVFDRADLPQGLESESWPADPGWPRMRGATELTPLHEGTTIPALDSGEGYPQVDPLYWDLTQPHDRLEHSQDYRVIAHLSWIQQAEPHKDTLPALIHDPDDPDRYQPLRYLPELIPTEEPATLSPQETGGDPPNELISAESLPAPEALPAETLLPDHGAIGLPAVTTPTDQVSLPDPAHLVSYLGPPQYRVFGTVRLLRKRYLHLQLDLLYRPEADRLDSLLSDRTTREDAQDSGTDPTMPPDSSKGEDDGGEGNRVKRPDPWSLNGFLLRQERRIRGGELHYFDHPLFGVLARVKPIDPPLSPGEEEPGAFPGSPPPR